MGIDGGHLLHRSSDLRGHFVDLELDVDMSWVLMVVIYPTGVATFVVTS